jgi:hypothetical protein
MVSDRSITLSFTVQFQLSPTVYSGFLPLKLKQLFCGWTARPGLVLHVVGEGDFHRVESHATVLELESRFVHSLLDHLII